METHAFQQFCDSADILRHAAPAAVEGIYIHVPFCFHKCHYCDFYSVVASPAQREAFVRRLIEEITAAGRFAHNPIRTVFIGGGTPTLLGPNLWQPIFAALHEAFDCSELMEFTSEANPETVDAPLADALVRGGVNRLSIGAQSFDPRHLKTLERWHQPARVAESVRLARSAGIDNIGLDLMFAIPGQSTEDWLSDLDRALSLEPTHLSCYALTYEPNTPLTDKLSRNLLTRCDEALEAAMYEHAIERLDAAGFEHYEISNFALPGRRCAHNMLCWTNGDWLAFGPSAAAHIGGLRWKNADDLDRYLAGSGGAPIEYVERLDTDAALGEALMLRLRLIEGAELAWLEPRLDARRRDVIRRQVQEGYLERTATHLRLTRRGLLVADTIMRELL